MSDLTNFKQSLTEYSQQNQIVIPVNGKIALIPGWNHLTLADNPNTLQFILNNSSVTGLALLCGVQSGLLALDIDQPELINQFIVDCPDLADTRQITTQSGCKHFYYLVKAETRQLVTGGKFAGVDLIWKNYVVAPPAPGYAVAVDRQPLLIGLPEYARLLAWCTQRQPASQPAPATHKPLDIDPDKLVTLASEPATPPASLAKKIVSAYRQQSDQHASRNTGLFYAAIQARDHGLSASETASILYPEFIQAKPYRYTSRDDQRARHSELISTVKSAFKKPARTVIQAASNNQLPDAIREHLAQHDLTYLWRVYDALALAGFRPGQEFTRQQAWQAVKGHVGRDSLYKALETANNNEKLLFAGVPLPKNPPHANAAFNHSQKLTEICISVGDTKPGKTLVNGGRPPQIYTMPTPGQVAKWSGADDNHRWITPLDHDQLASVKTTRATIHHSLIQRRPALYSRKWLADRLGVHIITVKRYDALTGIYSEHRYTETPLSIWNIDGVMTEDRIDQPGYFLMDSTGKRYPAIKALALRLLQSKKRVSLFCQIWNYYTTIHITPPALEAATQPAPVKHKPLDIYPGRLVALASEPATPALETTSNSYGHIALQLLEPARLTVPTANSWKPASKSTIRREKRQEMFDQVGHIQAKIPGISAGNIKALIQDYGYQEVISAVDLVLSRDNVRNMAGFVISILKSRAKVNQS